MLSHVILSVALTIPMQCPGGTCRAPVAQATHSVLKKVVAAAEAKPVRTVAKVAKKRLVRRWRIWR